MKTNKRQSKVMILSFLALCLGIVSCYDDTALLERIEALETTKIASINQQIDAIKASITNLETTDKELDAAIAALIKEDAERDERIKDLNDSIAELQAADKAIQAEIAGMAQTLQSLIAQDGEFKEQIAEIESAIAELRAVDTALQAEISAIKETLQTLAERDERFQSDIDSLKAKDIVLDIRIEGLKAFTDSISSATKDWTSATFSTLEQYQATCYEIAAIKVLIAEQEASLTKALTDAIAASETSMKGWVNEQLTGYWTIAETQAKLDTIKTNTDKEVEAVKADLKTATEELTAAYKSEIAKAITDSEGKLSSKIDEINSTLDKRIGAIEARLDAIEEKLKVLDTLTREFAIKFDDSEIGIMSGGTSTVGYTITGATDKTTVKALGQSGWTATVTPNGTNKGTITVTAPNPIAESEIIVLAYDGEYRTVMSTINFVKGFATPSRTAIEFGAEADTINIELTSNLDYEVSIPIEAQSWLSVVEPSATRAITTKGISFACTECIGGIRRATVSFVDKSGVVVSTMSFIQQGSAVEVTLTEAGTLLEAIGKDVYQNIKALIINGPINGTDIIYIRRMGNLEYLNMGNARIVEGGVPYYTGYNKYYTSENVVGANMFSGAQCFQAGNCEIILPSNTLRIEDSAFGACKGLSSVHMPSTVQYIGNYAFSDCERLTSINIPSTIRDIGVFAFYNCHGLTKITLPSDLESISDHAFHLCNSLTNIILPSNLKSIGDHALQSCNLEELVLPDWLISIGEVAFSNNKIKSLTIPSQVKSIGYGAFNSNPITEVHLKASPATLQTIENNLFDESVYVDAQLYIPKGTLDDYSKTDFGRFINIIEK